MRIHVEAMGQPPSPEKNLKLIENAVKMSKCTRIRVTSREISNSYEEVSKVVNVF